MGAEAVATATPPSHLSEFAVGFLDPDPDVGEVRRPLGEVAAVAFESARPVRAFPSYRGQRNYPGFYYAACLGKHVEFESWLERDEAMALDFDSDVVAFAAQPLRLFWTQGERVRSHVPDFFARTAQGQAVLIDCRPRSRIRDRDVATFAATERACGKIGWEYRLVTGHDPIWLANLRWLTGYRHPRYAVEPVATRLLTVFSQARPIIEGARLVGDPIAVLPVVYHLLWTRRLATELTTRLEATAVAGTARP